MPFAITRRIPPHPTTLRHAPPRAQGIAAVANGLQPLHATLESLSLDFGYDAIQTPAGRARTTPLACLGRVLGGFTRLRALRLDLDTDVDDADAVRALGLHLACLPGAGTAALELPGLDGKTGCHCGLMVDSARKCLVANQYYDSEIGKGCFKCMPDANATACQG